MAELAASASPTPGAGAGFARLGLCDEIVRAVQAAGYNEPTPVQQQAIPAAMTGSDLMVSSSTGSGKTASFVLPSLHRLAQRHDASRPAAGAGPSLLVLAPTRELAIQVAKACEVYGARLPRLRVATVLGGVPYALQLRAASAPLDVLIATPGRLLDLLRGGRVRLSRVQTLVLDEADRMLDMGFIDDIRAIAAATPSARQTLLFSATLGGDVARLSEGLLRAPRRIELQAARTPNASILQRLHWADNAHHKQALLGRLLTDPQIDQAIVFTSTQLDAERISSALLADGHSVAALHGGMPQGQRNRTLGSLRRRQLRVLVATDVAARGIDVPTISHVINYGLPLKAEDYVHRIGRTGRAGRAGLAVTLAEHQHAAVVRRIERFTGHPIPVTTLEGLEPRTRAQFREATRKAARKASKSGARATGSGRPFGDRRPPHGARPR
ncbi:MAG TPA: DEAD/DEAH box helicase [Burkholderiaceae bacterium]|nr:DEAD/DEAH box helicase [Burkholderiaceae bacterium]